MKSSFGQLTKRTGLTGVLVGLRSRTFSSMTNILVQSCYSTLSSNQIIYHLFIVHSTGPILMENLQSTLALRTPHHCHFMCSLRSIEQLIATNLCLEIAGTVEPCEGKALVLSSDDQSACIIKRRSKCLYQTTMVNF